MRAATFCSVMLNRSFYCPHSLPRHLNQIKKKVLIVTDLLIFSDDHYQFHFELNLVGVSNKALFSTMVCKLISGFL